MEKLKVFVDTMKEIYKISNDNAVVFIVLLVIALRIMGVI